MTATVTDTRTPVLTRVGFRFSPSGARAMCLAGDARGGFHLEAWSFAGPSPCWCPLLEARAVTPEAQAAPLDDGCVLLCHHRARGDAPDDNGTEAGAIALLDPRGEPLRERVLGVVPCAGLVGLRLLPGHGGDPLGTRGTPPNSLGLAVGVYRDRSTIWRLAADVPRFTRLAEIPGVLLGGTWLDDAETLLGFDRAEGGGPAKPVVVDLRDGSWTPLLSVSAASNDRLLLASPRSGLVLVSTDASGEERLGWGRLGAREPVRFPDTLHRPDQALGPLTLDPDGQRVLLQLDQGARSRLAIYTPATDRLASVEIPAGSIRGPAHWARQALRFPFSTPSRPTGVATVPIGQAAGWSLAGSATDGTRWADAHVERLEGPCGPIEAIIYGDRDWRASTHLVLALHGGPLDAWRLEFQPLFQLLASAGIAVIAPNQRGSSGYGARHALAIRGAWGGPDLDDVCSIARGLVEARLGLATRGTPPDPLADPRLMLLGVSYGAYLALLAAGRDPDSWSRCVAIAPFLSGARLHREASSGIKGLIERLGGCEELHDRIGPRDVLRLCPALRAKLLVVHGERDEIIPVSQSRALRSRLLQLGRREGADFDYLEVPGGRHELTTGAGSDPVGERLVRFLLADDLHTARRAWPIANPHKPQHRDTGRR